MSDFDGTDRIPLPSWDELDAKSRECLAKLPPVNVAPMLMRTGLGPQIYAVVAGLFADGYLPALDREIMLYRVCRANSSQYEINFHKLTAGVDPQIVDAVLSEDPTALEQLDDWHRELCLGCDEITMATQISTDRLACFVEHYGSYDVACRAIFLISWFNMLSRYVDSTGVPAETAQQLAGITDPLTKG